MQQREEEVLLRALARHRLEHGLPPSFLAGGDEAEEAEPGVGQAWQGRQGGPRRGQEPSGSGEEQQQQPRWKRDPRGPGKMAQSRQGGQQGPKQQQQQQGQQSRGGRAGEARNLQSSPRPVLHSHLALVSGKVAHSQPG